MFASLGKAVVSFFDGTLRGVLLKSILLTLALFIVLFIGVEYGLHYLPRIGSGFFNRLLELLAPVLLILSIFLLGAPVAAIFASLYLDQVARRIEAKAYPSDAAGQGTSLTTSVGTGVRLAGLVVLVNLLLLPFDIELPGISEFLTVLVNAWLLGREYFELAALRHLSRSAADALRRRHGGALFAGGLVIAIMSVIPFLDLIAPVFDAALMVHMFKRFSLELTA